MSNGPMFRGTTICAVRRNGETAIAGDGQVTMGESVVFKSTARKVRRLYNGQVVAGFAGGVSDAFTLCEKFEEKLTQYGGNMERAHLLMLSGTGEVIDPDGGVVAIGSGGNYALAAARALMDNTDLSAHEIAEKALHIAASICVYTNDNVIVEEV